MQSARFVKLTKKLLLIGGTGFVGSHIRAMPHSPYFCVGTGQELDVRNTERLKDFILSERPDYVVHLAAITTVGESFSNPQETYNINFGGTLNVLTALREARFKGRMLYVGSSDVYGSISEFELPVSEDRPLRPRSPYAVSKVAAEALCYQWSQTENFEIICARPFNHIGPGQSERFAIADFARQISAIRLGLSEPIIHVGDIDTTRDFTDVRDVIDAYFLLLECGCNGEIYNVCSGIERSMRSLIKRTCELAEVRVELRTDVARFRPSEQRRVRGCNTKLVAHTGWQPKYSLDQTLSEILSFWDRKLNG